MADARASFAETLNLFEGDPLSRLMGRLRLNGCARRQIARRVLFWVALAWMPPLVLAGIVPALAHLPEPPLGIFDDLVFHVRGLVAIPILVAAECHVAYHLARIVPTTRKRGMVRPEDQPRLDRAKARLEKLRASAGVEVLILALSLALVGGRLYFDVSNPLPAWHSGKETPYALASLWNRWIGLTVYYFLLMRWAWRYLLWCSYLLSFASARPRLEAHHPDEAAGLSFVVHRHLRFALPVLALSAVVSSKIAQAISFGGASLESFASPIGAYIVVIEAIFVTPLLAFSPLLIRARREGIEAYGSFANRYVGEFDEKWLGGGERSDLLGTPDIQSLNDLTQSYGHQVQVGFVLMNRKHMTALAILTMVPLAPLVLFKVPTSQLLPMIARLVG